MACWRQQAELHTIPFSHYCDIARWSLQLAGESFQERGYLPGIHQFSPATSFRKHAKGSSTGKGASLPYFAAKDGQGFDDSWRILAKFWGEVPADIVDLLNEKVGPQVRTLVYSFFLVPEMAASWRQVGCSCPVPAWQRFLWRFASGKVGEIMYKGMVKDEAFVKASRDELDSALTTVEELLAKPGNAFEPRPDGLPSPAGLALASLMAPLVAAEGYSGGLCDPIAMLDGLGALPEAMQKMIEEYRARPAGKFVLETYKQRMNFPGAASSK